MEVQCIQRRSCLLLRTKDLALVVSSVPLSLSFSFSLSLFLSLSLSLFLPLSLSLSLSLSLREIMNIEEQNAHTRPRITSRLTLSHKNFIAG